MTWKQKLQNYLYTNSFRRNILFPCDESFLIVHCEYKLQYVVTGSRHTFAKSVLSTKDFINKVLNE